MDNAKKVFVMLPSNIAPIPPDTARAAKAAFGYQNAYMVIGNQLDHLTAMLDQEISAAPGVGDLHSTVSLILITAFQFFERLSDTQACEALRTRVNWRYALHLPQNPPDLLPRSLCEFRQLALSDASLKNAFHNLCNWMIDQGACESNNRDTGDAVINLQEICLLTRVEDVETAINRTLETLAAKYPLWLRENCLPHWFSRYNRSSTLPHLPNKPLEKLSFANTIGSDAFYLLEKISQADGLTLQCLPSIVFLQRLCNQQFDKVPQGAVHLACCCSYCKSCTAFPKSKHSNSIRNV